MQRNMFVAVLAAIVFALLAIGTADARNISRVTRHAAQTLPSAVTPTQPEIEKRHQLIVGTRNVPPFAFKDSRGEWQGLSIDLWRDIADRLKLDYKFEEASTVKDLIQGVETKRFDAAVAALTVTEERERVLDFSHPFFSTGLAIATLPAGGTSVWSAAYDMLTVQTLGVVSLVFLTIVAVGLLLWFVERKINSDINSAGEGFWASLTMLLTSQFTEPEPKSAIGRTFAAIWVLASIVLMTFFTGVVTSALTVQSLQGRVHGVSDLPNMRVGTVTGSTGAQWLVDERIHAVQYASVADGLKAIVDGQVDAFVYDAPVLQYMSKNEFDGKVFVLPDNFAPQDYAIALPESSPLRRPVNQELIAIKRSDIWKKRVFEYLGER